MFGSENMTQSQSSLDQLRNKGYKITPQRRAVITALEECAPFPTVQQLQATVRRMQPDVSLDTIYRNLTLLTERGIVHEIHRPSGNAYELVQPGHHHHHLICTECGKTECIDICPMNKIYEKEAEKRGFQITGHIFEFYGLCWSCRSKAKKQKG